MDFYYYAFYNNYVMICRPIYKLLPMSAYIYICIYIIHIYIYINILAVSLLSLYSFSRFINCWENKRKSKITKPM